METHVVGVPPVRYNIVSVPNSADETDLASILNVVSSKFGG
jgi:hypothetical protein